MTKIYSIKDAKAQSFTQPWYSETHGTAERFISTICAEQPDKLPGFYQNVSKFPQDFDLYHLGEWDNRTGKITLNDAPAHISNCQQIKDASN